MLLIHKITGQVIQLDTLIPDPNTCEMFMTFHNIPNQDVDAMQAAQLFAEFRYATDAEIDQQLASEHHSPGRSVH